MRTASARALLSWNSLLAVLLAACIVRLWLVALRPSLWADEAGTFFVVHYGAGHPSFAVAPQVPQSIYYWLPWAAEKLGGFSEVVYRVPSVLVMGAALWLIARLAARLIHPQAAWFTVFLCLSMRGFNLQADDARPYGLGVCVAAAGVWFLVRWLDSGKGRHALLFVGFAALLWRVQLVYWTFYPVFAIYAGLRLAKRDTPVTFTRAALTFAFLGLALAPVALRALTLFANAGTHLISPLPAPRLLFYSVEPGLFLVSVGGVWLAARLMHWPRPSWRVSRSSLALIMAWWLCPTLALFAISWISGQSLFVTRYYSLLMPGAALMGTALAARFVPVSRWPALSAILAAGVLLYLGEWRYPAPRYHNSDWRGASQTVNARLLGPDTPVICLSPYIEAHSPVWHPDYPLPAFLYAPLAVYPVRGRVITFPFRGTSPEAELYAASLIETTLKSSPRFFIYGSPIDLWQKWFQQRLGAGWTVSTPGSFGNVFLVEFDRSYPASGIQTR